MKTPECVCKTPEEYIRVALAIETLAYHDKNYLDSCLAKSNARISEEVQSLLTEALRLGALKDGRAIDADTVKRRAWDIAEAWKDQGRDYEVLLLESVVEQIVDTQPTLTPPNEPMTCVGCIYEPDCPSEIHCHGCARIFVDHYRRPPEGEADA